MPPADTRTFVEWGDATGRIVGLTDDDGGNVCDIDDATYVWFEIQTGAYMGQTFAVPVEEVEIVTARVH